VFIRRHLPQPADFGIHGAAPWILAVVALIGWLLAAYFASQVMHMHASLYDALGRPESIEQLTQGCDPQP
jgi:hypothetical protein